MTLRSLEPKSRASANSATFAQECIWGRDTGIIAAPARQIRCANLSLKTPETPEVASLHMASACVHR
jgi:hypothetical protein